MNVAQAREIARLWVQEEGIKLAGFSGAFLHGSINWLSDDADLPASSDVDILVVFTDPAPSEKLGKFLWRGVLLEVSYLPADQVRSAEQVLGSVPLAGSFRRFGILADTMGHLTQIQTIVSQNYAKRYWVAKRCEQARSNVLNVLSSLTPSAPYHDQVTSWLFANGITTHILLTAGLKNPTVRRRYVDVKELLTSYHRPDFHETLLEMLGCAQMSRERAEEHLKALTEAFDTAKSVLKTPYRFAADISDSGRPVAIGGSRELIERGLHREAIFWITATYSRCQSVLANDASTETQERLSHGYRHLLHDLGITSFADLERRGTQVRETLPAIWDVAEDILAANPEITD